MTADELNGQRSNDEGSDEAGSNGDGAAVNNAGDAARHVIHPETGFQYGKSPNS